MKKVILTGIICTIIGLLLGSFITYQVMNKKEAKKDEDNKLTFQETLAKEAKKLSLRNDMYNYVEAIEARLKEMQTEDKKQVLTFSNYLIDENKTFIQVDEEGKKVKDGIQIDNIAFKSEIPKENSKITINQKGNITEATILVEGYQLHYDLIGVKVTETTKTK